MNRAVSALGAGLVQALMIWMLLGGPGAPRQGLQEPAGRLIAIDVVQPTPPARPPSRPSSGGRPRDAPAPAALRATPRPLVAPPPLVEVPRPIPILAAPIPSNAADARAGAAERDGPGTGAGGAGHGLGGGGRGGWGGGDGMGRDRPPRWRGGRLKDSDYPRQAGEAGIGGTVSVRYRVNIDGRVSDCRVTASSGNVALDETTCRLIERRFRFDPARDEDGRPVPSTIVENHSWLMRDPTDPPGQGGTAALNNLY
ncbi:energy transducer TonB [Sphingomonas sp.]|uniref:energy transducer TonB n=1 Tax=Sphingomonas sp. TaxID=28214 RepID=UPI003B3AB631